MTGSIEFLKKKVHYKTEGTGRALVLIHGFIESLDIWDDFSAELKKDFQVVSIDLPGHGFSEQRGYVHTMPQMADCVNAVLEHLGISSCVMAGHSMGGYVALAYAKKYTGKTKGLVIFHSHAAGDTEEGKKNRERAIRVVESEHGHFIWSFIPDLFAPENRVRFSGQIKKLRDKASLMSKDAIIAALEGMKQREDMQEFLSGYDQPVMFIVGKKDSRIQMKQMIEQIALPRHSEALILGDAGHMGYIEERDVTLAALAGFVSRID